MSNIFDPWDIEPARCHGCGCTDDWACEPPCWWVDTDLCSSCNHTRVAASNAVSLAASVAAVVATICAVARGRETGIDDRLALFLIGFAIGTAGTAIVLGLVADRWARRGEPPRWEGST